MLSCAISVRAIEYFMRCGIDIVEIKRFERFMKNSSTEQMQRVFSKTEWDYCQAKPRPMQSLAARFAAKEACMKLFPAETNRAELDFIDIEVITDQEGSPNILVNEKLKNMLQRYGLNRISISISHTASYACGMAVVI